MTDTPTITADDVSRWLGPAGATRAVATLLPDNEDGHHRGERPKLEIDHRDRSA